MWDRIVVAIRSTRRYRRARESALPPTPRANMRNLFIVISVLFLAAPAFAGDKKKPNILFIYTDDQSYRTVSCYPGAYKFAKTPNIDRLASMGIRFEASYNGSWCAPSRASILAGHHPFGVQ